MNIKRIGRLISCRVFRDFTWPKDLHEFARFNLIYGWNGSGKTTLSRILRDLELRRAPADGEVTLPIGGQDTRGVDFPSASIPVRVFNRDFVSDNVFPISGGDVPPILILGEENIEKQKKLEVLKSKLAGVEGSLQTAQNEKRKADGSLDNHCIANGGSIRTLLRGSGNNAYNNYNKGDYRRRAQKMLADRDAANHRLEDAERENLTAQHLASPKPPIEELTCQEPDFVSLSEKTAELLSSAVVSETIQSLKDDAETSEWVRQGLDLHKKHNAVECLFCEQSLPGHRLAALEQHFNAAYQRFIKSLEESTTEIEWAAKSLSTIETPSSAQFYDHLVEEYEPIRSELEHYRGQATTYWNSLAEALTNKKEQPFDPISMSNGSVPLPDGSVLSRLNGVVQKHNQACENHTTSAMEARQRLESGLVAEGLEEFETLCASAKTHEATIATTAAQLPTLRAKISSLEVEITEHRRPAEELNDDFHKYVGHEELQLEVKDHGYTVTRNGVPASQLSEGETTAFALLYFLKALRDHRFDFSNGVVVLDDPISSLDANSLFLAYGFIQERTKDVGQLFILTHNFTFFRQVRNWFHQIKGQRSKDINKRPARFYMLNCLSDDKGRYSNIQNLDPLLERYESDYHYLSARVLCSSSSSTPALETNYGLPNMARRLLEAFLAFRQPDVFGGLWQKMQNVDFEEAKKSQILRFVHTYSHNDAIVEPDHDPSMLGEAPAVLSDLLDLIKSQDSDHYKRMVQLVARVDHDEDE